MFSVQLSDFRCFRKTEPIEIRPITLLIGENSSGKTSFLAALRQLLQSFSQTTQNPFNSDPYFLGGFDQISHYRGGRSGRAKSFELKLLMPAEQQVAPPSSRISRRARSTSHSFTFEKGTPQPDLSRYVFSTQGFTATISLAGKTPELRFDGEAGQLQFDAKHLPDVQMVRRNPAYLQYVVDEFYMGALRKQNSPGATSDGVSVRRAMDVFRSSSRRLANRVFASSPVRTEPLRTYTPSEILASSQGAHVPLEMARQKLAEPESWKAVQQQLAEFGKNAGLFDDIDIRQLGKRDGDPFQVLVRIQGPRVNLVDVGYGVSQALPIIYQLQNSINYNAFLLQQPEVHLHPRAQAEIGTLLSGLTMSRKNMTYVMETHSDYIIDRLRIEVATGSLDASRVTLIFFQKAENDINVTNLYLNDRGEITNAPPEYRGFFLEEHAKMLGL